MAFDQPTRNRLQKFVSDSRDLLSKEFRRQLQAEYGMDPTTGGISSLDVLTYLDDNRLETARLLRDTLEHYLAGDPSHNVMECLDRIVREQAFTVLNRLCALRMAEARGILIESIGNGYQSRGFQLYARLAGPALGETGDAYRCYLFSIFDEFALDLAVLFDRFSPQDRLFPRESALLELLSRINHPDIAPLWAEDETIGWIYQYFNSPEERRQMRAESQAPRTSRELAVRNQFFTPRYVVEFLTDNTLGRIWYEMTQGNTVLKEQCRYLVRRPNEIFLAEGKEAPQQNEPAENLSQEELLKQPVYIPLRRLKDPREILMLDPACGSMHFGLYAFDLFEKIYEEAWELEGRFDTGVFARSGRFKSLRETYGSKEALTRDVPRLIIEYNIHGIDIDPRAVQIAGLSLWLRAQRSWQTQGIKPQDRPQILKSNVVCAEPMPGEKEMLREFTENLKPRVLGQLVEIIFDKMQLAGEAGSLLKIEEEIEAAIAKAREDFKEELLHRRDADATLFPELLPPRQTSLFDFTDMPDKTQFWNDAEQKILDALREYAERADTTHANRKRLFAQDAARGFAFIDICRIRYDVVLMNPPFGDATIGTRQYLLDKYSEGTHDICAAFVLSFITRLSEKGLLGAITTRLALFIQTFTDWRSHILDKHYFSVIADLGYGVLDAMVETAMFVVGKNRSECNKLTGFIRLLGAQEKQRKIEEYLLKVPPQIEWRATDLFNCIPGKPLAYWVPNSLLRRFYTLKAFNYCEGAIRQGFATADDYRFLRLRWEVPKEGMFYERLNPEVHWVPMPKGGEYSPWWDDIHLVINWYKYGHEVRNFYDDQGKLRSRPQNIDWYFREGATYPYRTTSSFGLRYMPQGCIFSVGGWGVFPPESYNLFEMLAIYNTRFARYFMEVLLGQGDSSVSGTAARNYGSEAVGGIPWPDQNLKETVTNILRQLICLWVRVNADETYQHFDAPCIIRNLTNSLKETSILSWLYKCNCWLQISNLYAEIEEAVSKAYRLSDSELESIAEEEGQSLAQYTEADVPVDELIMLFSESVEGLVSRAKNYLGAKRYVVKKAYFINRVVDISCHIFKASPGSIIKSASTINPALIGYDNEIVREFLSWVLGCIIGRWDIRYATREKILPELPNPFEPLPICPPGMLKSVDGFPAEQKDTPKDYPLRISWEGILVDDEGHTQDIVGRVRSAIEVIWKDKAEDIEQEACEIIGVSSLRDYFCKPGNFFAEHMKRYSKSRRQAPIYWPISTISGSYTLWLYYHRLTDQVLYICVNDFVEPKLKDVTESASRLRQKYSRSSAEEKELERLSDLELELKNFRDELLRVAAFWKPNLNDGVQITAAPLWKLFRHTPWQRTLKETRDKLERGDYDWAHLAYSIWPKRVREKCKRDKSLAIAHDLEELYEEPVVEPKKKGGGRRGKQQ
jgi:hypothetical protein